jgi:hypothetical protein
VLAAPLRLGEPKVFQPPRWTAPLLPPHALLADEVPPRDGDGDPKLLQPPFDAGAVRVAPALLPAVGPTRVQPLFCPLA